MTIAEMHRRVKSIQLRQEVPKIVENTSYEIEALNKLQLNQGLSSDGDKIKIRYRSNSYAKKKNQLNPAPGFGVPDLFLTGSFYKGIGVVVRGYSYEIDSKDEKSSRLEKKYGKQIFGLTPEHKSEYAKGVLFNGIKSYIEIKTGLKFG